MNPASPGSLRRRFGRLWFRKCAALRRAPGYARGLAAVLAAGAAPVMAQPAPLPAPLPSVRIAPTPVPAADSAAVLAQVRAHLKALRTLTADFTQTAATGAMARGRMTLARPGKVRFEYTDGSPFLIVSNGTMLNQVDYELKQVQAWPVRDTPLALLIDPDAPIARNARVVAAGPGALANQIVIEAQDPRRPEYGTLTLLFAREPQAPAGLALTGWRVLDAQGALTTVALANTRFNIPVDGRLFTFRDPRLPTAGPPGRTR